MISLRGVSREVRDALMAARRSHGEAKASYDLEQARRNTLLVHEEVRMLQSAAQETIRRTAELRQDNDDRQMRLNDPTATY